MGNYSDIMKLPRPILHHIHMDVGRRAKQFAPFAALKGFEECVRKKEILYEQRPVLCEDRRDELDWKLQRIRCGMSLTVTFFRPDPEYPLRGWIETISGTVEFFDPAVHLRVGDMEIHVRNIIDLNGDVFHPLEEPS